MNRGSLAGEGEGSEAVDPLSLWSGWEYGLASHLLLTADYDPIGCPRPTPLVAEARGLFVVHAKTRKWRRNGNEHGSPRMPPRRDLPDP